MMLQESVQDSRTTGKKEMVLFFLMHTIHLATMAGELRGEVIRIC
jgi:hypothetical protein